MKDWTGNKHSIFNCIGARAFAKSERVEYDYYATAPKAAELLLVVEPYLSNIWEPACGEGHLAKVFAKYNKLALATDLIDRGYGNTFVDFLNTDREEWEGDIVTNPPYKYAKEFVEKALNLVKDGHKVCMFLKLTFLETKSRKEFFKKYPPQTVYVSCSRIPCARNGKFTVYDAKKKREIPITSAVAYAWFVWQKGYTGDTIIKWIN